MGDFGVPRRFERLGFNPARMLHEIKTYFNTLQKSGPNIGRTTVIKTRRSVCGRPAPLRTEVLQKVLSGPAATQQVQDYHHQNYNQQ
jgi:hypothetical protein